VIVHADVRDVRRHELHGLLAAELQRGEIAGRIEVQEREAKLKPLRPLGPAARGVAALDGEDRRAVGGIPSGVECADFLAGKFENAVGFWRSFCGVSEALIFMGGRRKGKRTTKFLKHTKEFLRAAPRLHRAGGSVTKKECRCS